MRPWAASWGPNLWLRLVFATLHGSKRTSHPACACTASGRFCLNHPQIPRHAWQRGAPRCHAVPRARKTGERRVLPKGLQRKTKESKCFQVFLFPKRATNRSNKKRNIRSIRYGEPNEKKCHRYLQPWGPAGKIQIKHPRHLRPVDGSRCRDRSKSLDFSRNQTSDPKSKKIAWYDRQNMQQKLSFNVFFFLMFSLHRKSIRIQDINAKPTTHLNQQRLAASLAPPASMAPSPVPPNWHRIQRYLFGNRGGLFGTLCSLCLHSIYIYIGSFSLYTYNH